MDMNTDIKVVHTNPPYWDLSFQMVKLKRTLRFELRPSILNKMIEHHTFRADSEILDKVLEGSYLEYCDMICTEKKYLAMVLW